jgi:TPR repeat protein
VNRILKLTALAVACGLAVSAAPSLAQPQGQAPRPATNPHPGCSVCDGQRLLNEGQYGRAMTIFQHRAAEGEAGAMNDIAFMYEFGLGRPVDFAKAREWYRKAAELHHPAGLANLGHMYEYGEGGRADYAEAGRLYREGANAAGADLEAGDAAFRMALLYQRGRGQPVDLRAAMCWYQVSQNKGDMEARPEMEKIMAKGQPYPMPAVCDQITGPVRYGGG